MTTLPFLSEDHVHYLHAIQLREFGGQDGLRDRGMLQSALAMPESGFSGNHLHSYPFGMAAAYAFHVAQNQPFFDGNKRVALHAALMFLDWCGIEINDPDGKLYEAMIAIAEHRLSKEGFADLFETLAKK